MVVASLLSLVGCGGPAAFPPPPLSSPTSKEATTVAPPAVSLEPAPVVELPPATPPPLTLAWMKTLGESRGVGDVVAVRQDGSILVG